MNRPPPFMVMIVNHVRLRASPAATVVCLGCLSNDHEESSSARHILWRCHIQNNHMTFQSFAPPSRQSPEDSAWEIPRRCFPTADRLSSCSRLKDEWSASVRAKPHNSTSLR